MSCSCACTYQENALKNKKSVPFNEWESKFRNFPWQPFCFLSSDIETIDNSFLSKYKLQREIHNGKCSYDLPSTRNPCKNELGTHMNVHNEYSDPTILILTSSNAQIT